MMSDVADGTVAVRCSHRSRDDDENRNPLQKPIMSSEVAAAPAASEEKSIVDASEKHPLQNKWSMWYDAPQSGKGWEDKLQKIYTFDSVEDFWRLVNNLAPPSKLPLSSNYHMFKDGIKPAWEDPSNENGGKWHMLVPRNTNKSDPYWLYSLLALIGEELDADDEICGVVMSPRKVQDKLAIWTRNAANSQAVLAIGQKLRQVLDLPPQDKIEYLAHADAMHKGAKARFTC